ncbi:beta-ketothiolase BktB [Mesorhizobium sp. KR9-304]|uniref:beta-ketothiolase BktB n=1 Tax=Mesorhizobium sp. KR9-304 TaxID=3156614 RepID=UPI0032B4E03F
MPNLEQVVIASGVRTAIGAFGGSLAEIAPTDLASNVTAEALKRAKVEPSEVGHVVFGNVIHTEPRDAYMARVAALGAGLPVSVPALTVNRLCGSGLQAVVSGLQTVMLGDADIVVAGGAESMSRAPYSMRDARWGKRMGDANMTDMLIATLHDPFGNGHMGITAENIAADRSISRETQDMIALRSHHRARQAISEGRFSEQILPVEIKRGRELVAFDTDEHVRDTIDIEGLAKLRPAFRADGTVTAGNASGVNDGAAALVLMHADRAARDGIRPLARFVSYGFSGVDPSRMGLGPIPAVRSALSRAGLCVSDMDVIESNEAFAAQACAVAQELEFPEEKTNPNGGAIALGHPVGATGAIILVKLVYELQRIGGRYGLATLCIGGGQGIAVVVECGA